MATNADGGLLRRQAELARFANLPILKTFNDGRQSKYVRLLEGNVVAKAFNDTKKQRRFFRQEARNLRKLRGCPFAPQLLAIDEPARIIYMTYCGTAPKAWTPELRSIVFDRLAVIKRQYGLTRKFLYGGWLPRLSNVAIDKPTRTVSLIDFGTPWRFVDESKPKSN
jgi:hypothetical protein